jgi:hypothetical protein
MTLNWPATTTAGGGWMGRGRKCKEWPMGCRWIEQAESTGGVWHDRRFFTKRLGGCVTVTQWLGGRGLCRKKARPKMDTGMQAWWNGGVQFLSAANRMIDPRRRWGSAGRVVGKNQPPPRGNTKGRSPRLMQTAQLAPPNVGKSSENACTFEFTWDTIRDR